MKKWSVKIEEDPETGEAILNFPFDFLEETGWKEGDTLIWEDLKDGTWALSKKGDKN
jgi:hypothetical protein